jgi:universal stress protein E
MNTEITRILAVIDPTRVDQWALKKAIAVAKSQQDCSITAYLCIYSSTRCNDPERLRTVEIARYKMWLAQILMAHASDGVTIEPMVEWNADWREAVCIAAEQGKFNLVVKQASGRPTSLANSDRQLIRTLEECALLLVKHDPKDELTKVLVAVDFNAVDEGHSQLNQAIMELGKRIRGSGGNIELHSISAYPEADKFMHPPDIAKTLGISRAQAHVRQGSAEDVIPLMANKIDADLVIVGSVGRRGFSGMTAGNTAEKILVGIEADVLVIGREQARERSAA